jgi:hypothetical protein
VTLDVSGAFTDVDGDTLTYTAAGLPTGLAIDSASGVISGTIAANASQSGPFAVTVTADDGQGGSVDDAFFTWTVNNPAPTLVNNTGLTLNEGATAGIDKAKLEFSDINNPPGQLIYTVTGGAANGRLELTSAPGTAISSFTQAEIDAGLLVYVHDDSDTTSDSFSFAVADIFGGTAATTVFNITVNAVDDTPPFLVANSGGLVFQGSSDPIQSSELRFGDTENPGSVAYTVTTVPANGQLERTSAPGTAITGFTQAEIDAGLIVYVHDGTPTLSDSFVFTVDDGQGNSVGGQIFNILVTVNNPPVVNDQILSVDENSTVGTVVGSVAASDPNVADTLSYSIIGGNLGGAFSIDAVSISRPIPASTWSSRSRIPASRS